MILSDDQIDVLRETINMGVGQAASILSDMIGDEVSLEVPDIRLIQNGEDYARARGAERLASIQQKFSGAIAGSAILAFPTRSATALVEGVIGGDASPQRAEHDSVLMEIANILLNGIMGALGDAIDMELEFELPVLREATPEALVRIAGDANAALLLTRVRLGIERGHVEGEVLIFFGVRGFENLSRLLQRLVDAPV